MADVLTKSQTAVDHVLFDIVDQQRTFDHNYGEALTNIRRGIVNELTIITATGLVLGGLVGAIAGMRRR